MDDQLKNIRFAAQGLLARREYSAHELRMKLLRKFPDDRLVNDTISTLIERNLLSDVRFTESFINMRCRQYKGPLLIISELKAKGIESLLIESCMKDVDIDWIQLAKDLRIKKFGSDKPRDSQDRAKQIRHLQSRGFASDHIRGALAINSI